MTPIFLVVGSPAVGKSTTAAALARRFAKSIHIPVDALRDMVAAGQVLPGPQWDDELIEQLAASRASAVFMALTYRRAGFAVVIDDFWDPNSGLAEYAELFSQPQMHRVLLYPQQSAARARNRQRAGSGGAAEYIDDGIGLVYAHLDTVVASLQADGWLVLDTTEMGVEDAVSSILELYRFARQGA